MIQVDCVCELSAEMSPFCNFELTLFACFEPFSQCRPNHENRYNTAYSQNELNQEFALKYALLPFESWFRPLGLVGKNIIHWPILRKYTIFCVLKAFMSNLTLSFTNNLLFGQFRRGKPNFLSAGNIFRRMKKRGSPPLKIDQIKGLKKRFPNLAFRVV